MLRKSMQIEKGFLWWHATHVVSFSKPLKKSRPWRCVVGQREVGYSEQLVTGANVASGFSCMRLY